MTHGVYGPWDTKKACLHVAHISLDLLEKIDDYLGLARDYSEVNPSLSKALAACNELRRLMKVLFDLVDSGKAEGLQS